MSEGPNIVHAPLDCAVAGKYRDHVAVIGNMDGVHKGHQALIAQAAALAEKKSKPLAAIIFDPHPRQVFDPAGEPFLLTTREQKCALLGSFGVDTVFILPFNRRLSMLEPEEFVENILVDGLGLAGVLVGAEFQFGRKRAGTAEILRMLAEKKGVDAEIVTPIGVSSEEEKYSSSEVRKALKAGEPGAAAAMLGRPWVVSGIVQKGQQLGRTLKFPTANISLSDYIHPRMGVYAVHCCVGGTLFKGVANFGSRPTVDGTSVLLEVFLFDFDRDIYGETVEVEFHHFIRPEKKFSGLEELKAQIAKDGEQAAMLLA